ncbi:MAG: carbohydrate ABC transporter permease [Pleurocapsa sp. SU_196_0]|nr:carbohydrate ABC transporter permease [Pleurocapsa sp. SU_196_0]
MTTATASPSKPHSSRLAQLRPYLLHAGLLLAGFYYVYPFIWMVGSALKTPGDFFTMGLQAFPENPQWQNFPDAWNGANFGVYFFNSVFISVIATVCVIILTAMTGYVISRHEFPGRRVVIGLMAALFFFQGGYAILPLFDLVLSLGLLNTYWSIILVEVAGGLAYFTAMFSGYFVSLPKELEESAAIDGASFPMIFWKIALPQARPMIATVGLFYFMSVWNSYLIPLVMTLGNKNLRTLAVGMTAFFGENSTQWTWVCAGAVISITPVMLLFVFLQRYFVESIAGAVKG